LIRAWSCVSRAAWSNARAAASSLTWYPSERRFPWIYTGAGGTCGGRVGVAVGWGGRAAVSGRRSGRGCLRDPTARRGRLLLHAAPACPPPRPGDRQSGCCSTQQAGGGVAGSRGARRTHLDPGGPLPPPLVPADTKVARGAATCHPYATTGEYTRRRRNHPAQHGVLVSQVVTARVAP
jgi:hypothetical protein